MNTRCLRCSRAISSWLGCVPGDAAWVMPAGVTAPEAPEPASAADDDPVSPEAAVQAAAISTAAATTTRMRVQDERGANMAAAGYPIARRTAGPAGAPRNATMTADQRPPGPGYEAAERDRTERRSARGRRSTERAHPRHADPGRRHRARGRRCDPPDRRGFRRPDRLGGERGRRRGLQEGPAVGG